MIYRSKLSCRSKVSVEMEINTLADGSVTYTGTKVISRPGDTSNFINDTDVRLFFSNNAITVPGAANLYIITFDEIDPYQAATTYEINCLCEGEAGNCNVAVNGPVTSCNNESCQGCCNMYVTEKTGRVISSFGGGVLVRSTALPRRV